MKLVVCLLVALLAVSCGDPLATTSPSQLASSTRIDVDVVLPPAPMDPPGDIVLPPATIDPPGDIVLPPVAIGPCGYPGCNGDVVLGPVVIP